MISIIIPIWDEPYIRQLVEKVRTVMFDNLLSNFEIIIVSRGFSHSAERLDFYPRVHIITQRSVGLGNAILEGVDIANGDIIVTMDGDGSHLPKYLPNMIHACKHGYDIVIGSKYVDGGESADSWFRHLISRIACKISKWILGLPVDDTMSGFSAVKHDVYDNTRLDPWGYKINMEILFKNKDRTVHEMPITFIEREYGKSKFGFREFFRTGLFVLKLRYDSIVEAFLSLVNPIIIDWWV